MMEARVGIEPTHKGFADLSLTTWVPRLTGSAFLTHTRLESGRVYRRQGCNWSGRPGSNRRHLPWQGSTLPLSYSRSHRLKYSGPCSAWSTQRNEAEGSAGLVGARSSAKAKGDFEGSPNLRNRWAREPGPRRADWRGGAP